MTTTRHTDCNSTVEQPGGRDAKKANTLEEMRQCVAANYDCAESSALDLAAAIDNCQMVREPTQAPLANPLNSGVGEAVAVEDAVTSSVTRQEVEAEKVGQLTQAPQHNEHTENGGGLTTAGKGEESAGDSVEENVMGNAGPPTDDQNGAAKTHSWIDLKCTYSPPGSSRVIEGKVHKDHGETVEIYDVFGVRWPSLPKNSITLLERPVPPTVDARLAIPAWSVQQINSWIAEGQVISYMDEGTSFRNCQVEVGDYTVCGALVNGSTTPAKGPYFDLFVVRPSTGELVGEHEPIVSNVEGQYRIPVGEEVLVIEIVAH